MKQRRRWGFVNNEHLVVLAILGVLAGLLIPAVNQIREVSRKMTCAENMRHMGLAMLEYEQTYKRLTSLNSTWGYGGYNGIPFWNVATGYGGAGRWSGLISLLPYLDEGPLHTEFDQGTSGRRGDQVYVWGPYGSIARGQQVAKVNGATQDALRFAWSAEYKPNRTQVSLFRCPQDRGKMRADSQWPLARTNYAFCLGDGQIGANSGDPAEETTRGAFQLNKHYKMSDITDGWAHTLMFGEIATAESSSFALEDQGANESDVKVQGRAIYELAHQTGLKGINVNECRALVTKGRYVGTKRNWGNVGSRAYDALATYTGFNTINAPNAGSCTPTNNAWGEGEGIQTLSSYHRGGTHAVTFDGKVHFINDGINTTDNRTETTVSEYYSPGRAWVDGGWQETPNWAGPSPFGAWGAMGNRAGNDYACGDCSED